ncbi:MAG: phosphatidate cytidylyltransferase [Oscillospiraceae bacterium]|nr:phosphatidate cytidylyltransferase [Oscillospiraceae bacterium]
MKTRIIVAAVLLPIFFAILFIFPPYILTIMISVICAIAAYELLSATKIRKASVIVYTIFSAVLMPFSIFFNSLIGGTTLMLITLLLSIFFLLLCLLVIEAILAFNRADNVKSTPIKGANKKKNKSDVSDKKLKFRQIPIALAAGILIPYLLTSLISLREMPHGYLFVLLPVIVAIMTDSGAYFSGVAFGKKKPFPKISPNKTVEGFIGGIICGAVGMLIYGLVLSVVTSHTIVFPALVLYGLLGAFVTILGDLAFSLIKRKCGIKDYGRLFPGHGGALDRFDSMIFAAPTMYLLTILVPAIII